MKETNKQKTGASESQWDETFQLMHWWKPEDVQNAVIMVVGAGALGNEVLKNLALLNVGHILIVDFDTVEYSNLSRSILFRASDTVGHRNKAEVVADRIREINPNVKVKTINGDIMVDVGIGVFRRVDVVIGCLDNLIARLYINRHAFKVNKTWIDGAIEDLSGQMCVYKPGISCYESQLSSREWQNIRFRLGCADVAQRNSMQGRIPTTPISSSIIAAMQVQEALKVILGNEKRLIVGKRFRYEGMFNEFLEMDTLPVKEEDNESLFRFEDIIEANELSHQSTIKELFDWLKENVENGDPAILLDYEVVLEVTTQKSEQVHQVIKAKPHFTEEDVSSYQKEAGETVYFSKSVNVIDRTFPDLSRKLSEIGVPPLQILSIDIEGGDYFVELTGDQDFMKFN